MKGQADDLCLENEDKKETNILRMLGFEEQQGINLAWPLFYLLHPVDKVTLSAS